MSSLGARVLLYPPGGRASEQLACTVYWCISIPSGRRTASNGGVVLLPHSSFRLHGNMGDIFLVPCERFLDDT